VDESTVTIENIHQHLDMGKPKALAIWDACREIAFPKLLILFCILAVFAPAFTMKEFLAHYSASGNGHCVLHDYFLPTGTDFFPILANWLMTSHHGNETTDAQEFTAAGLKGESDTWDQKKILFSEKREPYPFENYVRDSCDSCCE